MKGKRRIRKSKRRIFKKKVMKKGHRAAKKDRMMFNPRLGGLPFPSTYLTKMVSTVAGYTTSGVGSGTYHWFIKMNSIYQPFALASGLLNVTLLPAFSTTSQPTGFNTLFPNASNLYTRFRVVGSKCDVQITPQSIQDSVEATLTPSTNSADPGNLMIAYGQRLTKSAEFNGYRETLVTNLVTGVKSKARSLSSYCTMHQLYGVAKKAIDYDLSGQFTGTYTGDPPVTATWVINVNTGDNTVLNSPLEVKITMVYYVLCYGLSNAFAT